MGSVGVNSAQPRELPQAQQKTLNRIINKTKNLKNEQYRIVDADGNVILERKGDTHSVAGTVGEKRDKMMGNIGIHNHPDGGTFSSADFKDFGFGATDIVVTAPEGVYRLSAIDPTGNHSHGNWTDMRDAYDSQNFNDRGYLELRDEAQKIPRIKSMMDEMESISKEWLQKRQNGASQSTLDELNSRYDGIVERYKAELKKEIRNISVTPNHEWLQKNARKYGYIYTFTPHSKREKK